MHIFTTNTWIGTKENRKEKWRYITYLLFYSKLKSCHLLCLCQYPSAPRKSSSMRLPAERENGKEVDQYPSKSKRLLKALLSRRKSKKDDMLYTYLDEYWKIYQIPQKSHGSRASDQRLWFQFAHLFDTGLVLSLLLSGRFIRKVFSLVYFLYFDILCFPFVTLKQIHWSYDGSFLATL